MKTLGLASLTAITFAFASLAGCAVSRTRPRTSRPRRSAAPRTSSCGRTTSSQYHFHLRAGNHAVLVTSEAYTNRTGALNGLLSVLDNGGLVSHYQILTATNGQPYFNLLAANKQVIATSETYSTKQAAQKGVNSDDRRGRRVPRALGHRDRRPLRGLPGQGRPLLLQPPRARTAQIVLQSQGYSSEAAALNGTFSVADNGVDAGGLRHPAGRRAAATTST